MTKPRSSPAWSYTSLTLFEQCPKKYYHLRVAKDVVDKPFDENDWGRRAHKALELHARNGDPLPDGLTQLAATMRRLLSLPGERLIEEKLALTANLEPCGYFDRSVWYRGVVDYGVVGAKDAVVVDYKTGKKRPDHDQLSLFAATIFTRYPQLEQVRTAYLWTSTNDLTRKTFTRADAQPIWASFIVRAKRIELALEADKFPAKPSGLCGWCPVQSCPHWVKR